MVSTREDLIMVRRFLLGMALTGAALIPAMSAADASVNPPVPAGYCVAQGGHVVQYAFSTALMCRGGMADTAPVYQPRSDIYGPPFTVVR
jgi:hypothetical protein